MGPPGKRPPSDSAEGDNKRGKLNGAPGTNETNSSSPMLVDGNGKVHLTGQLDREGAVGGIDTGGTGSLKALYSTPQPSNTYHWKFRTVTRYYTHAYAQKLLSVGTGSANRHWLTTCMSVIPSDKLCMYMSPSQYDRLPLETYATSAHQKVYVF
jgi:hypothetical protein